MLATCLYLPCPLVIFFSLDGLDQVLASLCLIWYVQTPKPHRPCDQPFSRYWVLEEESGVSTVMFNTGTWL
jgi:hypothetical protein